MMMKMSSLQPALGDVGWTDPKRYWWLLSLLLPAVPLVAWGAASTTGVAMIWYIGPVLLFVVLPVVDMLGLRDADNPPEEVVAELDSRRYYRWLTYLFVVAQFGVLVVACELWSSGSLGWVAKLGLALTIGTIAGIAINAAHELGHKAPTIEKWLSKLALAQTCYGHFYTEHNRGHHKHVATPADPASSRLGESFYAFYPRTVIGSVRSAIAIERTAAARLGRSFWSVHNAVLHSWAMSVVLFAGLAAIFGAAILPWLAVQAVIGFSLLEVVNYIEHYGLLRATRPDGRHVRCEPVHSWNANNTVTNLVLFQLQRHSDHHANPLRRYQSLRHFDEAPQLPTGYAGMIVLALVPPLWRRVMDPKVLAHYGGDVTLANLHPPRRRQLLASYRTVR